jgi:hypothetical protein
MTPEQLARVTALHEKLIEVSLADADPDNWIGTGLKPKDMDREARGDAQWCRRIAISTVTLTMQVQRMLENPITGGAAVPSDETAMASAGGDPTEVEINKYERAASQVLARMRDAKPARSKAKR